MESRFNELYQIAFNNINKAYCPYSKFKVSAALVGSDNQIYSGINIENASYPCGVCAEASAICSMVTNGCTSIKELVVMCDHNISKDICSPCGLCRQRIREFSSTDLPIHLCNTQKLLKTVTLEQLLYLSFGPDNLSK